MRIRSTITALTTAALLTLGTAAMAEDLIYCPTVQNIENMCDSTQQYNVNIIPFPNCLIMKIGKRYTFNGGASWELNNVIPPYLVDPLQFSMANVDNTGTHCLYKTKQNGHYVRFTLAGGVKLLPGSDGATSNWKEALSGKNHGLAPSSPESDGNLYTCKAEGNPMACPFINSK